MKKRAYVDIQVFREINVSSSGHYFGKMRYVHNGRRITLEVDLSNGVVMGKRNFDAIQLPQYVLRRVWELYLEAFEKGHNRYFEYDRDGNKRYDDLRYYSHESVDWITQCIRRELDDLSVRPAAAELEREQSA